MFMEAASAIESGREPDSEQTRELREIRDESCFSVKSGGPSEVQCKESCFIASSHPELVSLRSADLEGDKLLRPMWEDKLRPLEDAVREVQGMTNLVSETLQWMLPQLEDLAEEEILPLKNLMSERTFSAVAPTLRVLYSALCEEGDARYAQSLRDLKLMMPQHFGLRNRSELCLLPSRLDPKFIISLWQRRTAHSAELEEASEERSEKELRWRRRHRPCLSVT